MKLNLLALILLWGVVQSPPAATGTIEGRVLRTGTAEPIPNTPVTLISTAGLSDPALSGLLDQMSQLVTGGLQGQGGGGSQDLTIRQVSSLLQSAGPNVSTQASVLTDRSGHYEFKNLPPGRYTVWVQRFNYFGPLVNGNPASTASVTILLDPSKAVPATDLFLTPGMAISGRVLDALGQPANAMTITAYRSTYFEGRLQWSTVLSRAIDDRGEYRLSPLPPGAYYVGVTPPLNSALPAGQNTPVRTFFPGVSEPSQATDLILKSGDVPDVNFNLRSAPATFYKIAGFAANPVPSRSAGGAVDSGFNNFVLLPVESSVIDSFSPNTYFNVLPVEGRAAGEFEIRNVRPGIYELYAVVPNSTFLSGRTIVDVRSSDALGIRVAVNAPVTMRGTVTVTGGNPQRLVNLNEVRAVLRTTYATPSGRGAVVVPVNESGQFTVSGPAGASATMQVSGLPETAFVADVRVGAGSVLNRGFELSASDTLEVVIDVATGATIDTTVRTADGRPAPRARVVLVPSEDQRQNPSRYKTGTTDNDGRLVLRGIAPGSYTAFAWESVAESAWQNKEFIAKFQEQGTSVNLTSAAQANLPLKWIPFDQAQH